MEILELAVVKRDGSKEAYARDKLASGLKRALEKRPVSEAEFKKLINLIELDIQASKKAEISSDQIGKIAMNRLRDCDQVAYIRFASVYKSFEDAATFQKEIKNLIK
jgi:transcriptional repressor NrdR